jgi:hypothetical protein
LFLLAAGALLAACGTSPAPAPEAPPPPPAPPAACLLDTAAMATATGVTWTPEERTASDTRCVYDPAGAAATEFVTVEIAQSTDPDPAKQLDTIAALCDAGSRAPVGEAGFVCRYEGGTVYAAAVRDDRLVTVAASAIPQGTTAARMVLAFTQQLTTPR